MPRYIDIHTHILPGLDDGPADMEAALKLGRTLVEQGFHTVVATPHCREGQPSPAVIRDCLQELRRALAAEQIPLVVLPGAELAVEPDLVRRLRGEEALTLNGGRYVLVELPFLQPVPPFVPDLLFELRALGYMPVLAHPERVREFQSDQASLHRLVRAGAYTQITLASLTGRLGPLVKQCAERMLRARLVHFVATDAHGSDGRLSIAAYARSLLSDLAGSEQAEKILEENAALLLRNRPLRLPEAVQLRKRKKRSRPGKFDWKYIFNNRKFDLFGE